MIDRKDEQGKTYRFEDLVEIVAELRGENGCPWDREQTHRSIRNNLLEEAYEAAEGIDKNDPAILREELGDLLLQIVFHVGIEEDAGHFTMDDVTGDICRKMIRRHPHVYSNADLSPDGIQKSWDDIKKAEKGNRTLTDILRSVSPTLPALMRSVKFIEKQRKAGEDRAENFQPKDEKERMGKEFYDLCRKSLENGVVPEEALQSFLDNLCE